MLVISDNVNVVRDQVARAVKDRDGGSIRELAHKVSAAGADAIDINVGSVPTREADEVLAWLVDEIQAVTDVQLSLDARTVEAIVAGAERAKNRPILNSYFVQSARPGEVADRLIPYAAENGFEIMLPAMGDSGPPMDPDTRASIASELVDRATEAGLDHDLIYVDPVVVHLGSGYGQEHAASVIETVKLFKQVFDPPVKVVAGVEYLSQGAPGQLRSPINRVFLAMLSALDLDAAIVDVNDREVMRDIRLIKGLRNESLYSVSDAELK